MAYRLIECALSSRSRDTVLEVLDEAYVLGAWSLEQEGGTHLVRILVELKRSEGLIESLEGSLSLDPESRIFLSEVLATLPEPEQDEEEEQDAGGGEASQEEGDEEPPPDRVAAVELSTKLRESVELSRNFFAMLALSVVVAAVGLTRDDVAVVIGAMVIAPLLAPHMAIALGTTLGDLKLLRRAGTAAGLTVVIGAGLSLVAGLFFPVDPGVEQFVTRTEIAPSDVILALAAGAAGALAFTSGVSQGIVGVMVAVSLLPPLAAAGLLAGVAEWEMAARASLLFASNVVSVNLAAIVTFFLKGLRPSSYWEEKKAQRIAAIAVSVWAVLLVALLILIIWLSG